MTRWGLAAALSILALSVVTLALTVAVCGVGP